ncbi:MAG: TatD family hydrolase [Treponema sp.]|nr:TatD family hydrolase [Treponema sp.]
MHYIDFHTHLDCYENQEDLLGQLAGFEGTIVSASMDALSYQKNLQLAEKAKALGYSSRIIPTFGIHPKEAVNAPQDLSVFDQLCAQSPVIGEIGMDFCWYKEASPQKQEEVLRYFLNHCNETGKVCVIHTKDAEKEICRILEDYPKARPVIHWYDGPEDIFQEFMRRGYMTTFGCETIRSQHIQKLLQQTPLNQLLAESDNPDSEPWLGGSDNSVNLIKRVYSDIAQVLGKPVEEVGKIIEENSNFLLN